MDNKHGHRGADGGPGSADLSKAGAGVGGLYHNGFHAPCHAGRGGSAIYGQDVYNLNAGGPGAYGQNMQAALGHERGRCSPRGVHVPGAFGGAQGAPGAAYGQCMPSWGGLHGTKAPQPNVSHSMAEMVDKISAIGVQHGITREIYSNAYVYMVACPEYRDALCPARILGMYSQNDGLFYIRRCDTDHTCAADRVCESAALELRKAKYRGMRCGELVERLAARRMVLGYPEVYALVRRGSPYGAEEGEAATA